MGPGGATMTSRGRGTCAVRIGCTTQVGKKGLSAQKIGFTTKVATRGTYWLE